MATTTNKPGPTREQLTDQQWFDVCRLFDTIKRINKRLILAKAHAA